MTVVLLGPQRRPSLHGLVTSMGWEGPFATITAGWQERELADAELDEHLGGRSHNLSLWHRMQQVFEADPQYAAAHRQRRADLLEMQDLYVHGLRHTMAALIELNDRTEGSITLRHMAIDDAIAIMRGLDSQHMRRVAEVQQAFYDAYPPHERESVQGHRAEVARILADCSAVVITGGHVVELLDALHLFNVAPAGVEQRPVVAWSAGAMVLTSHVVLFGDHAVRGPGCPEVFDRGLGLLPGIVALPSASQRLELHDRFRMSVLSRRFAPDLSLPLDPGTRIVCERGKPLAAGIRLIGADGTVTTGGEDGAQAGDQPPA
ncbi:hypothetical protein G9U51_10370 [Calidifontibacter sp. DB0510]|uniref:Cyanophycinase n=1 Tax=Metallococcus carri TaxID=1656884 RepID=A0A967AZV4_9MICO|nr:hypothetical protein [Metallococcus carri]NHN56181.1 hypothetical protein [Metallococcus carri]NOP38768.1 hypothetical protein [Calidifontibacter sp. DB2511S]